MNKMMMAIVMIVSVGTAYAADFGSLAVSADSIKASADSVSLVTPNAVSSDSLNILKKIQAETGVQGTTYYEVLKNLFEKGVPASDKDLTGWYSGRTVLTNSPNSFLGSIIIGAKQPVASDGGPLFPQKRLLEVVGTYTANNAPDYFEKLSLAEQKRVAMLLPLGSGVVIPFPAAEGMAEGYSGGKTVAQYRKTEGYVFEHMVSHDVQNNITRERYSYYFSPITNSVK
ncbi:MAG TPA: hypothetical protein DCL44_10780 [Elusimicrobia bacterium]|nr:hypothetical protein [Elusimicrobiota bacterium]